MSGAFDPYHIWLGIAPKDQPPNHYRLLGIDLFESDPRVIESAADRQMAHVRTFQTGPSSEYSQRLLNEIATAKVCLLRPEKKQAYDAALRQSLQPETPAPLPMAIPLAEPLVVAKREEESEPFWQKSVVLYSALGIVGALTLLALMLMLFGPGDVEEESASSSQPVAVAKVPPPKPPSEKTEEPETADQAPAKPALEPAPAQPKLVEPRPPEIEPVEPPELPRKPEEPRPEPQPPQSAPAKPTERPPERQPSQGTLAELMESPNEVPAKRAPAGDSGLIGRVLADGEETGLEIRWKPGGVITDRAIRKALADLNVKAEKVEIEFSGVVLVPNAMTVTVRHAGGSSNGGISRFYLDHRLLGTVGDDRTKNTTYQADLPRGNHAVRWVLNGGDLGDTNLIEFVGSNRDEPLAVYPEAQGVAEAEPTPQPPAKKHPVPEAITQQEVEQKVREVFKAGYAGAMKPEGKASLAKNLLDEALEAGDNPTEKYVMLNQARKLAAEAGEAALALKAIEEIETFEVDLWKLRLEAFSQLSTSTRSPAAKKGFAETSLEMVDRAMSDNRYDLAGQFLELATGIAAKSRDAELREGTRSRRERLRAAAQAWEQVRPAFQTLEKEPNDPAANLAAGKFLCFVRQDWKTGLSHLAKGSDTGLKDLAQADLEGPNTAAKQIRLADRWWDLAQLLPEEQRAPVRWHAGQWYVQGEPLAEGLDKERLAKRIRESGRAIDLLSLIKPKQISAAGNWQFDGKVLVSPPDPAARLQLPYAPPAEYDLYITAQRLKTTIRSRYSSSRQALVLGLSAEGRQFIAVADWYYYGGGGYAYLALVNGNFRDNNPTYNYLNADDPMIREDRPSTVVCSVRKHGVNVRIDDVQAIAWNGDYKDLSLPTDWTVPDRRRLFIGSSFCTLGITRLELRVVEAD